jgi:hypothetical protein
MGPRFLGHPGRLHESAVSRKHTFVRSLTARPLTQ